MLRSLNSGISGMQANQTALDVIGNNIANEGTTAFKASRTRFQDMLSQTVADAGSASTSQGGTNPSQIGLGTQLAGIDTIVSQGTMQSTNRNLDMALDGDGYFMVGKGPTIFRDNTINVNQAAGAHNVDANSLSASGSQLLYTRDGSLALDDAGNLLTSNGYRIMGYSLSNDVTNTAATAIAPSVINAGGFNFQFGPGEALNGYSIALGDVGAGTTATAVVDKTNKKIILNGDFSAQNAISASGVQTAVNNALSQAGIAQTVSVVGNSTPINGIASSAYANGVDPAAPQNVSAGGFTFSFNQGSQLNGYTIRLGNVAANAAPANPTTANIDTTNQVITINGDFTNTNAITAAAVQTAIRTATPALPAGATVSVSGSPMNISPSQAIDSNGSVSYRGLNISFKNNTTGNGVLVGDTIQLGNINASPATAVLTGNVITINGNVNAMAASDYQAVLSSMAGLPAGTNVSVTGAPTLLSNVSSNIINGGANAAAPTAVSAGGLNFTPGVGSALNGYSINIGTISAGTTTSVDIDTNKHTITVNGDFVTPGAVTRNQVQAALTNQLSLKGINQPITVGGTPITINGTTSGQLSGGTPVESITNNGVINFVDGTKELYSYDNSLKSLRIPDTVHDPATGQDLRVTSFSIDKDGVITATLEDKRVATLGQIAMASFKNPAGLDKQGNNLYAVSVNSGDAVVKSGINTSGDDNSNGYGDTLQGMLEMSNVDLAQQFTDMIVASRAFQANGKTITTGDQVLQDIINLVR